MITHHPLPRYDEIPLDFTITAELEDRRRVLKAHTASLFSSATDADLFVVLTCSHDYFLKFIDIATEESRTM